MKKSDINLNSFEKRKKEKKILLILRIGNADERTVEAAQWSHFVARFSFAKHARQAKRDQGGREKAAVQFKRARLVFSGWQLV